MAPKLAVRLAEIRPLGGAESPALIRGNSTCVGVPVLSTTQKNSLLLRESNSNDYARIESIRKLFILPWCLREISKTFPLI